MRTAAKVFIIIGLILRCFLVYPVIVGIIALRKIENDSPCEYKEFAILVCLFCSLLGGAFMLSMSQEKTKVAVTNKNETSFNLKEKKQKESAKFVSRECVAFLMASLVLLMLLNVLFVFICKSSINALNFYTLVWYLGINTVAMIGIVVAIVVILLKHKMVMRKSTLVLLGIFSTLSLFQAVFATCFNFAKYYNDYYYDWSVSFGNEWSSWILFVISILLFVVSLIMIMLSSSAKLCSTVTCETQENKDGSNYFEKELEETKRMFLQEIITEEEYNKIRSWIISKYFVGL